MNMPDTVWHIYLSVKGLLPARVRVLVFTSAGERSVAARERYAGCLAAAWGGLEGFTPPHRFKARTAAFDGHCAFTRAARQRKAQVCGEITV